MFASPYFRSALEQELGSIVSDLRKVLGPLGIVAVAGAPRRSFAVAAGLSTVAVRVHRLLSSIPGMQYKSEFLGRSDDHPKGRKVVDPALTQLLVEGGDLLTDDELRDGFLLLCGYRDTPDGAANTVALEAVKHVRDAYASVALSTRAAPNVAAKRSGATERQHEGVAAAALLSSERVPSVLIVGDGLHGLPWEAALALGPVPGGVCARARGLAFAIERGLRRANNSVADSSPSTFVGIAMARPIINPHGDLPKTEQAFAPFFAACSRRLGWSALAGRAPSKNEYLYAHRKPLFVFMGHGSGAEFASRESIADTLCNAGRSTAAKIAPGQWRRHDTAEAATQLPSPSAALLFGCASGALSNSGECDPSGHVDAYLVGGTSGVLAFLWPVTDRDLDRFAARVIRYWMGHLLDCDALRALPDAAGDTPPASTGNGDAMTAMSLPAAVRLARADAHAGLCRLPNLTAAGCVVYGEFVCAQHGTPP